MLYEDRYFSELTEFGKVENDSWWLYFMKSCLMSLFNVFYVFMGTLNRLSVEYVLGKKIYAQFEHFDVWIEVFGNNMVTDVIADYTMCTNILAAFLLFFLKTTVVVFKLWMLFYYMYPVNLYKMFLKEIFEMVM